MKFTKEMLEDFRIKAGLQEEVELPTLEEGIHGLENHATLDSMDPAKIKLAKDIGKNLGRIKAAKDAKAAEKAAAIITFAKREQEKIAGSKPTQATVSAPPVSKTSARDNYARERSLAAPAKPESGSWSNPGDYVSDDSEVSGEVTPISGSINRPKPYARPTARTASNTGPKRHPWFKAPSQEDIILSNMLMILESEGYSLDDGATAEEFVESVIEVVEQDGDLSEEVQTALITLLEAATKFDLSKVQDARVKTAREMADLVAQQDVAHKTADASGYAYSPEEAAKEEKRLKKLIDRMKVVQAAKAVERPQSDLGEAIGEDQRRAAAQVAAMARHAATKELDEKRMKFLASSKSAADKAEFEDACKDAMAHQQRAITKLSQAGFPASAMRHHQMLAHKVQSQLDQHLNDG